VRRVSFNVSTACVLIKAPGVAKNVLMQLAEIANDDGHAWPSLETLCVRTCWSRTAVIEALAWLEQQQVIQTDKSNGRKTTYWLTPDSFTGERFPPPAEDRYRRKNRYASRTGQPVRVADPTGTPAVPDRYAKRTLTNNSGREIPPSPPAGGAPGFDAIVAEYPRRAGVDAARRVWDAMNPDAQQQAEIARAIQAWIPSAEWRRDGGRYVPKLGRFLRDKRWLDAPHRPRRCRLPRCCPRP
jgi:hypothetical protein